MESNDGPENDSATDGPSRPSAESTPASPTVEAPRVLPAPAVPVPRYEFETFAQLKQRPPAKWLVKKVLRKGGFAVLFGDPGSCKTFMALDIALCIAVGLVWAGFRRALGSVLYILAEGGSGLVNRITAWEKARGVKLNDDARFLLKEIQLIDNDDADALAQSLKRAGFTPELIIIDTFARCFVGGDENSAQDMGRAVAAVQRLQLQTGAAVLLVHHTTKRKPDGSLTLERGSGSLRGAADTMIRVTSKDDGVRVELDKPKDGPEWKDLWFSKQVVELGTDEDGDPITSLVLVPQGLGAIQEAGSMIPRHAKMLAALAAAPGRTLSHAQWMALTDIPDTTLRTNRKQLADQGLVERTEDRKWTLTAAGLAAATPPPFSSRGGDPDLGPAAATPPLGGGGSGDGDGDDDGIPDEYWDDEVFG